MKQNTFHLPCKRTEQLASQHLRTRNITNDQILESSVGIGCDELQATETMSGVPNDECTATVVLRTQ